jgi:hypothetical protein
MGWRALRPPQTDAEVPGYWRDLGLPGLVDAHVHVMPQGLLDRVWAYFDSAGPLVGRPWSFAYRWPQGQRLRHLRDLGVRAFATRLYAHKPQMAASLNDWVRDVAQFLGLADRYPSVHLDTTMVFVDFFGGAEAQAATASCRAATSPPSPTPTRTSAPGRTRGTRPSSRWPRHR